ncbi:unnamed protein product, partial [Ectocarpus sp. 4 AP-2014]
MVLALWGVHEDVPCATHGAAHGTRGTSFGMHETVDDTPRMGCNEPWDTCRMHGTVQTAVGRWESHGRPTSVPWDRHHRRLLPTVGKLWTTGIPPIGRTGGSHGKRGTAQMS